MLPEDRNQSGLLPANSGDLAQGSELSYLYKLFSSNDFAQRFEHYWQIHQIKTMVENCSRPCCAQETHQPATTPESQSAPCTRGNDPSHEPPGTAGHGQRPGLRRHSQLRRHEQPCDVATPEQAVMWKKVDALARQFGTLPGSTHANALRLRKVRGLLLWDIAHQSIEQREKQEQAATQLREESSVLGERIAAVQQQIRDATLRTRDDLGQRLAGQTQRIETIKRLTEDTLEALEKSMKADALALLLANQQRLADQLAEAWPLLDCRTLRYPTAVHRKGS